jgi:hypothetical protein
LIYFLSSSPINFLVHGGDKPRSGWYLVLEPAPGAAGGGVYNLHKWFPIKSTEGISPEVDGATDSSLPLEQLEAEFIIFINGFLLSPQRG